MKTRYIVNCHVTSDPTQARKRSTASMRLAVEPKRLTKMTKSGAPESTSSDSGSKPAIKIVDTT